MAKRAKRGGKEGEEGNAAFRAETDGTLRLVRGWLNQGVRMWKKEVQIGWFASTAAWRGREGVWEDYLILKKMERYTRGGTIIVVHLLLCDMCKQINPTCGSR